LGPIKPCFQFNCSHCCANRPLIVCSCVYCGLGLPSYFVVSFNSLQAKLRSVDQVSLCGVAEVYMCCGSEVQPEIKVTLIWVPRSENYIVPVTVKSPRGLYKISQCKGFPSHTQDDNRARCNVGCFFHQLSCRFHVSLFIAVFYTWLNSCIPPVCMASLWCVFYTLLKRKAEQPRQLLLLQYYSSSFKDAWPIRTMVNRPRFLILYTSLTPMC